MSATIHPSVGNGIYSPEELEAARIIASCVNPYSHSGPLPKGRDLGVYNTLVDTILEPYEDIDTNTMIAARRGEAYEPHKAAGRAWESLRDMSGTVTPWFRIRPLVDALEAKAQATPAIPSDVAKMPVYDKAGYVYCPNHRSKRLIRARSGNGWRCPDHMCFWWAGDGYAEPAALSAPAIGESTPAEPQEQRRVWMTEEEIDRLIVSPEMLVKDVLVAGQVTVVFGLGDSGKTFIVVDLSLRVAQHYPVLYVAGEDGSGIKIRKAAWQNYHEKPANGNFFLVDGPVNLMDGSAVDSFLTQIHPLGLKLIVFDTLSQCSAGADDSSNKEMSILTANANRIAHETGAAVVIIHHTTKGGENYRGASCIKDNTYGFLRVEKDDDAISFECVRIKNTDVFKPRKYRLITDIDTGVLKRDGTIATSCVIAPAIRTKPSDSLTNSEIKILEVAGFVCKAQGFVSATELQRATALEGRKFWGPLGKLKEKGMLTKGDKHTSPYQITERAKQFLNSAYKEDHSQYDYDDQEPALFEVNVQLGVEVTSKKAVVTTEFVSARNGDSNVVAPSYGEITYRSVAGYSDDWGMEGTTVVTDSNVTSLHPSPPIRGEGEVMEGSTEGSKEEVPATSNLMIDWGFVKRMYGLNELAAIERHCAINRTSYADVLDELQHPGEDE